MRFPSPGGVWVVSAAKCLPRWGARFPSPCGVWVVSGSTMDINKFIDVSVPLRGVGCFEEEIGGWMRDEVSVPLRGVGCFRPTGQSSGNTTRVSVPLRGVGCFGNHIVSCHHCKVSVPLRGVGCFETGSLHHRPARFPSPCGVWVVSMPLDVLNYYAPFPSPCGVWVVSACGILSTRI